MGEISELPCSPHLHYPRFLLTLSRRLQNDDFFVFPLPLCTWSNNLLHDTKHYIEPHHYCPPQTNNPSSCPIAFVGKEDC